MSMSMSNQRKNPERIRFRVADQMMLLELVLEHNPFETPSKWAQVQEEMCRRWGKPFSIRLCREHTHHVLKQFRRGDLLNLRKGLNTEQSLVKESMLRQAAAMEDASGRNGKFVPSTAMVPEIAYEDPDASLTADGNNPDVEMDESTKLERSRWDHEMELRERKMTLEENQLQLEHEKLKLDMDRFHLEQLERKARLEMELEERRHRLRMEEKAAEGTQQLNKMVSLLLEKLTDK